MDTSGPRGTTAAVSMPDVLGGVPVISVTGTPQMMGETIGRRSAPQLKALSRHLVERLLAGLAAAGKPRSAPELWGAIAPCLTAARAADPDLGVECEAMAIASGVPVAELLLVHGYGDLSGHLGIAQTTHRSTFVSLNAVHTDHGLPRLALAWHLDPELMSFATLIHRVPTVGPSSIALTLAGLRPMVGMSQAGLAVAANELRSLDGTAGLFLTQLVAAALIAPTREDAARRVQAGPRLSGGCLHLLDTSGERMSLELSGQHCSDLPDLWPHAPRVHCNQALTAEIAACSSRVAEPGSKPRLARIAGLAVGARSCSPDDMATWFHLGVSATNRSADGIARNESVTPGGTVLMVCDPTQRNIHVLRSGAAQGMGSMGL